MTKPTVLLSDLHLPPAPSPLREAFLRFVDGPARDAAAVYVLGDLFEYWIGDAEGLAEYAPEAQALRRLTGGGVPVYFQHGNRDFMVGEAFFRATGVQPLPDPVRLELAGVPTLLSHGDLFCTRDVGYQRWRRFSRNPLAQWIYRRLPRAWRQGVADGLRGGSGDKPKAIMDVTPEAIEAALRRHGVARLIHGHTHRPAVHALAVDGQRCERVVLADWRPERHEIVVLEPALRRVALP